MNGLEVLFPLSENDVESAYRGAHPKIDDGRTILSFHFGAEKVVYLIDFQTTESNPVLDKSLERWLCENRRLLGQPGRARVAVRVKFYIRSNFQGQRIATYIIGSEDLLFRRWGAVEVQAAAMELGRWVWTRDKFGYSMSDFDFASVKQRFRDWCREQRLEATLEVRRLSDFPREFLLSTAVSTLQLYKRL